MKRFLTPQEKKVLRYEKDRRNTHAESRARSRKAIAKRKALTHRALRHAQDSATARAAAMLDEADPHIRKTARNTWRKIPDAALGDYVARTLQSRFLRGMNGTPQMSALLRKARRKLVPRPASFKGPLQDDPD